MNIYADVCRVGEVAGSVKRKVCTFIARNYAMRKKEYTRSK
jgi:hypothetical protein